MAKKRINTISSAHQRIDDHEKLCRIMQRETNNKINENYVAVTDRITELQEDLNDSASNLGILKTRIDLLDAQINELKLENSNPLTR